MVVGCTKQPCSEYLVDRFADIQILKLQVDNFNKLPLSQKLYIYYLAQAALSGRDIIFDQNGKYNLALRKLLDQIMLTAKVDRKTADFAKFHEYVKRFWFASGIHHHYSQDKFVPEFSKEYFQQLCASSDLTILDLTPEKLLDLTDVIFNPEREAKKVVTDAGVDVVKTSAVNFYENLTQKEVEDFYKPLEARGGEQPVAFGLNSKLVKKVAPDGKSKIEEEVIKISGLYSPAVTQINYWLKKAREVASQEQKELLSLLIAYFETGDLEIWDRFNIRWVQETTSPIDFILGMIESYNDPLGRKGTYEGLIELEDQVASERTKTVASNAAWFEQHSPIDPAYKRDRVVGVTAKVINAVMLAGDSYPASPLGINLPNSNWIRKTFGSKSVSLQNIGYARHKTTESSGLYEEFYLPADVKLLKKYLWDSDNLHTDLHEAVGHASGKMLPGVSSEALKNYTSVIEETRAELNALYFMADPHILELKLLPNGDAYKAEYIHYITNALLSQFSRVTLGKNLEQTHMRARKLIAAWAMDMGSKDNVIEKVVHKGKVFFKINDYAKLRTIFGQELQTIQKIKSEGLFDQAQFLVEKYGVKIDPALHKEVLDRYQKLNIPPYAGYINPEFEVSYKDQRKQEIVDIKLTYTTDYDGQMLKYGREYSFLP
ncbi:MAG: hypothetical protein J6Y94_00795, partial [Bacteriovoracaceae bacterium]|nr:hypothetical protein [Bacteriovoracaceae bacterium]